jgi:alpha-glucosidase
MNPHNIYLRNMNRFLLLLYLLFFPLNLIFSNPLIVNSQKINRTGNRLEIHSGDLHYRIELCSSTMFRVRAATNKGFGEDEPWMVINYNWPDVQCRITEKRNAFTIVTDDLIVEGTFEPFHIKVYNKANKIIHADADIIDYSSGYNGDSVFCVKKLFADEHFFGFGERMDFIDQRGKKVSLNVGRGIGTDHIEGAYNILNANYAPVPFMMSTRGYGIFFHNAFQSEWDMGYSGAEYYSFQANGGELDYYFMYGPAFTSIMEQYTHLTGRTPLMPRFALGLHVGTYSGGTWGHEDLTSQYYVVQLARKLRELGIPADILHLDSTWRIFGKKSGKGGTSFEWRQPGFPDPKAMFDSLYDMHYQMVGLHIRPRIDNGEKNNYLDMAQKAGFTYPENGMPGDFPDFFNTRAADWWWDNCLLPLAQLGCKFVKTDEGSAFGRLGNEVNRVGPEGKEIAALHNLFPIAYAKAPFEHFMTLNGIRGMNHTREGFAGIQRYPFIFAGDWPSEWQYFLPVIRGGINCGLSGIGAWTHCMGGFEHIADTELYIRWCQFGMFSPVALLFGMEHPRYKEPWQYGEQALSVFREYDRLRYRLIPYIYSSYYTMYKTGAPIIRALVFHHPDDPNTYAIDDQYYFGDNFIICPVTVKGAVSRIVYLPEGTWYDYWSGKQFTGKQYILVKTPIEKLPVFVKGGSIIPMQPEKEYIEATPPDSLLFEIFPKGHSRFELYEDDGISLDYQKDVYAITKIESMEENDSIRILFHPARGSYKAVHNNYRIKLHLDKRPVTVSFQSTGSEARLSDLGYDAFFKSGEKGWFYDTGDHLLWISFKPDSIAGFALTVKK